MLNGKSVNQTLLPRCPDDRSCTCALSSKVLKLCTCNFDLGGGSSKLLGWVEMLNVKSFNHTLLPGCIDPVLVHFQEKYRKHALVFLIWGEGCQNYWVGLKC